MKRTLTNNIELHFTSTHKKLFCAHVLMRTTMSKTCLKNIFLCHVLIEVRELILFLPKSYEICSPLIRNALLEVAEYKLCWEFLQKQGLKD